MSKLPDPVSFHKVVVVSTIALLGLVLVLTMSTAPADRFQCKPCPKATMEKK